MPRAHSYIDDDPDTFPLHVRLALGVDRSWQSQSKCRKENGTPRFAWTVLAKETVTMGDTEYKGSELIAMALELCSACPSQWDCARYALSTAPYQTYIWGTWGADMADLRWAYKQGAPMWAAIIDEAEELDVPVQVSLRAARRETVAA